VALASPPVGAHDHEPPSVVMKHRALSQRGRLVSSCWTKAAGFPGLFVTEFDGSSYVWPERIDIQERARVGLTIGKSAPPMQTDLRYWRRVDAEGRPKGFGVQFECQFRPRQVDGKLVYVAFFRLPESRGDFFLRMVGRWQDLEGSDELQDATWTFRLRIR